MSVIIVSGHKSILKKKMKLSINDALKLYMIFLFCIPILPSFAAIFQVLFYYALYNSAI